MGWVRKQKKHSCHKPNPRDGSPGDVWQCDECDALWTVHGGDQREPGNFFTMTQAGRMLWDEPSI